MAEDEFTCVISFRGGATAHCRNGEGSLQEKRQRAKQGGPGLEFTWLTSFSSFLNFIPEAWICSVFVFALLRVQDADFSCRGSAPDADKR